MILGDPIHHLHPTGTILKKYGQHTHPEMNMALTSEQRKITQRRSSVETVLLRCSSALLGSPVSENVDSLDSSLVGWMLVISNRKRWGMRFDLVCFLFQAETEFLSKKTNVPKVSGSTIRFQDSKMSQIFNIKKRCKDIWTFTQSLAKVCCQVPQP